MRWLMTLSSAIALASVVSYVEMHADPAMIVEICCAVASIAIFAIGILKFGRRGFWLSIPTIVTRQRKPARPIWCLAGDSVKIPRCSDRKFRL